MYSVTKLARFGGEVRRGMELHGGLCMWSGREG